MDKQSNTDPNSDTEKLKKVIMLFKKRTIEIDKLIHRVNQAEIQKSRLETALLEERSKTRDLNLKIGTLQRQLKFQNDKISIISRFQTRLKNGAKIQAKVIPIRPIARKAILAPNTNAEACKPDPKSKHPPPPRKFEIWRPF